MNALSLEKWKTRVEMFMNFLVVYDVPYFPEKGTCTLKTNHPSEKENHLPNLTWRSSRIIWLWLHQCIVKAFSTCHTPKKNKPGWFTTSWWFQPIWKYARQIGNLPQIELKIKNNTWNHHLHYYQLGRIVTFSSSFLQIKGPMNGFRFFTSRAFSGRVVSEKHVFGARLPGRCELLVSGRVIFQVYQFSGVPWSKVAILGMVIPILNRNPYNGYINPYYWVDDHPLLYGNNGTLDPGTGAYSFREFFGVGDDNLKNCFR